MGYDCLLIPAPTNLAIAGGYGGFCGGVGLVTSDGAKPLNDAGATLKTVCCKLLSSTDHKMRNRFPNSIKISKILDKIVTKLSSCL